MILEILTDKNDDRRVPSQDPRILLARNRITGAAAEVLNPLLLGKRRPPAGYEDDGTTGPTEKSVSTNVFDAAAAAAAAAADDLQEGGLEAGQATAEGGKAAKRKKSKLGGASGGAARNVPVFFSPNDSIPPFLILPYVLICSLNSPPHFWRTLVFLSKNCLSEKGSSLFGFKVGSKDGTIVQARETTVDRNIWCGGALEQRGMCHLGGSEGPARGPARLLPQPLRDGHGPHLDGALLGRHVDRHGLRRDIAAAAALGEIPRNAAPGRGAARGLRGRGEEDSARGGHAPRLCGGTATGTMCNGAFELGGNERSLQHTELPIKVENNRSKLNWTIVRQAHERSPPSLVQLPGSGMILQELPASYAADLDRYSSSTRRSSSAVDSGVLSPDALSPGESDNTPKRTMCTNHLNRHRLQTT